jgi:peptidoglycan pentaglycine glycine transferase (the first glycine)
MAVVSLADWTGFLQKYPDAHLLQTPQWGELKSAFGWDSIHLIDDNESGAQILFRHLPLGLAIAYLPKPIFSSDLRALHPHFWEELDSMCRRKHAIFLKLEPDAWEGVPPDLGSQWSISKNNIQPPRTILVDLDGSEDEVLARMKQKCRYNIHLSEKKGVIVRSWQDLAGFHKLLKITGGRDGFGLHSLEYYQSAYDLFHPGGMCELLVAEFEGKPLAALMIFQRGRRAWYLYGASSDEERNRMPTYLLQWEAMRWAKARGCEEYDLWGVPDEDEATLEANFEQRHDGLWGVYRFKRGFGGVLKRAAQSVDKVYQPLLYQLYLKRTAPTEGG